MVKNQSCGMMGGSNGEKFYRSRVIYNSKVNKAVVEASLACKGKRFRPLTGKTLVKFLHQKTNPPLPQLKVIKVL